MSKTYPVGGPRALGVRQTPAGRGRGRGISGNQRMDSVTDPEGQMEERPQEEQPVERVQRRDAYTVITPDEKKRQSIAAKARREEENYQRYREKKKINYVSYNGTVGGDGVTEDKVRQQMQQTAKSQKINSLQKRQSDRQATKDRENAELDKMKSEQRRKSGENVAKQEDRQKNLQEEHRTKNDDFLKKIEKESKVKRSTRRNPVLLSAEAPAEASGSSDSLVSLQQRFPRYDSQVLQEILQQTNGDLALAFELLSVV